MSKEQATKIDLFKKWGAGFLGLISFAADIIAISELRIFRSTVQQVGMTNSPIYNPNFVPPTFGGFSIDDAVFLTGLFTVFVVANLYYVASRAREITDKYSYLIATFLSLLLTYLYFRLWLGEKWWILVCIAPIFLLLFIVIGILGSGTTGGSNNSISNTNSSIDVPLKLNNGGDYLPKSKATDDLPPFVISRVSQNLPLKIKPTISQPNILGEYWNDTKKELGLDKESLKKDLGLDWNTTKKELGLDKESLKKDLGLDWDTTKKELGLDKESLKKDLGLDKSIWEILSGDPQSNTMDNMAKNWRSDSEPKLTDDEIMEAIKKAWRDKNK